MMYFSVRFVLLGNSLSCCGTFEMFYDSIGVILSMAIF